MNSHLRFDVACMWVMLELDHVTSLRWKPFPLPDFITGTIQHVQTLRIHTLASAAGQRMGVLDMETGRTEGGEGAAWRDRFWVANTWYLSWKQISSQDPGWGGDRSRKASQRLWKSSQPQELVSYNDPVLRFGAKEKIRSQAPETAPSSNRSRVSRNIHTAHLIHTGLLYAGLCWHSRAVLQTVPPVPCLSHNLVGGL